MTLAEHKKYYWLKLKRDFFKRHDIKIIEQMPNGKDYVLFYLKMLLESIDHEGELRFSETIPYNEQMLSVITDTNVDIVKSAMKIFVELNMIEILDDSTIYMAEVQRLTGSETAEAIRLREYRQNKKMLQSCTNVQKCNTEKEKELEQEKEKKIEKKKKKANALDDIVNAYTDYEPLRVAIYEFIKMRKTIKAPMTDNAVKLMLNKLDKFATNDDTKVLILNQSIMNSWKGIFELKDNQPHQKTEPQQGTGNIFIDMLNERRAESYDS